MGKIIGAKIRTLCQLKNKGGVIIEKGEICTIVQSYRGYGIRTDDYRQINRVEKSDIEFIKIMKCKKMWRKACTGYRRFHLRTGRRTLRVRCNRKSKGE